MREVAHAQLHGVGVVRQHLTPGKGGAGRGGALRAKDGLEAGRMPPHPTHAGPRQACQQHCGP